MWGEIISAGASLLGGLLGDKEESTKTTIDYREMVKKAESAGFNPLTAIRNGGSAGFVQTSHPGLSSGAFIADAIGKVGSAIASHDPMAEKTAALEHQIRQETLRNLQADTAARRRASIGGVPVSAGAANVVARSALATPKPGKPFGPEMPAKVVQDEITNPFPTWSGIEVPGWLKSGDAWESFMGDLGTVPATAVNILGTAYHNFRKHRPDPYSPDNARKMRDYQNATRKTLGQATNPDFSPWGY
ncbi:MAG: hypothetical protein E5Y55_20940 [Mesorhizobium sp.]|uniref:hypothetical protein n=1 Tax=Mesorhizobium sp. TaxID=1871066 RepID=UPI00121C0513|nr:hypothetical protein [Mesorhizobium sp.]TIM42886.1 MAG: hypothetical protein E5Y55_20940 [Mesorhizobium sp.]